MCSFIQRKTKTPKRFNSVWDLWLECCFFPVRVNMQRCTDCSWRALSSRSESAAYRLECSNTLPETLISCGRVSTDSKPLRGSATRNLHLSRPGKVPVSNWPKRRGLVFGDRKHTFWNTSVQHTHTQKKGDLSFLQSVFCNGLIRSTSDIWQHHFNVQQNQLGSEVCCVSVWLHFGIPDSKY